MKLTPDLFAPVVWLTLLGGCAAVPTPIPASQTPVSPAADAPAVQFDRLVVAAPAGYRIGDVRTGVFCRVREELVWDGEPAHFGARPFVGVLEDRLARAGVSVVPRPQALFAPAAAPDVDLLVGGRIEALEAHLCLPLAAYGTPLHSKSTAYLKIRWQLHDRAQQRLVYETTTEGTAALGGARAEWDVIAAAYAAAVEHLMADFAFQRALRTRPGAPSQSAPN